MEGADPNVLGDGSHSACKVCALVRGDVPPLLRPGPADWIHKVCMGKACNFNKVHACPPWEGICRSRNNCRSSQNEASKSVWSEVMLFTVVMQVFRGRGLIELGLRQV